MVRLPFLLDHILQFSHQLFKHRRISYIEDQNKCGMSCHWQNKMVQIDQQVVGKLVDLLGNRIHLKKIKFEKQPDPILTLVYNVKLYW